MSRPGRAPQRLPPPEPSEGPHLAYAFQWFLFAALAPVGYVLLARREAEDRAGQGGVDRDAARGRQRVTG